MRMYDIFDFIWGVWIVPSLIIILVMLAMLLTRPNIIGFADHTARYEAREAEARADEARAAALGRLADNMPTILLFGGIAAAIVVVCLYRGRGHVETIKAKRDIAVAQIGQQSQPTHVTQNLTVNVLPAEAMQMLQAHAEQNNKRIARRGADYFLVDNETGDVQRVKPKQLTG